MIARRFEMAMSLCTCLQGGKSPTALRTTLASVALTRGRVIGSSLLTAKPMEQPRAIFPLA
jgi:hypothetical protein